MRLVWMFLALSLLTGVASPVQVENRGYILVGDSRTVGMDSACEVDGHANLFVVAKVGQGYRWLVNTAMPEVEAIKSSHSEIDSWTIVSNLGVNDIGHCQEYIDFYASLEDDFVFVSVNPVKNYPTVTNTEIENFNQRMRDAGFSYIDSYMLLRLRGFSTPDGLHYADSTYRLIFSFIVRELDIV